MHYRSLAAALLAVAVVACSDSPTDTKAGIRKQFLTAEAPLGTTNMSFTMDDGTTQNVTAVNEGGVVTLYIPHPQTGEVVEVEGASIP